MAAPRIERRYTPEEYLAYERQAPNKHEYIWVLKSQLRGRPCEV